MLAISHVTKGHSYQVVHLRKCQSLFHSLTVKWVFQSCADTKLLAQHVANVALPHKSTLKARKTQAGLTAALLSCHFTKQNSVLQRNHKKTRLGGTCMSSTCGLWPFKKKGNTLLFGFHQNAKTDTKRQICFLAPEDHHSWARTLLQMDKSCSLWQTDYQLTIIDCHSLFKHANPPCPLHSFLPLSFSSGPTSTSCLNMTASAVSHQSPFAPICQVYCHCCIFMTSWAKPDLKQRQPSHSHSWRCFRAALALKYT